MKYDFYNARNFYKPKLAGRFRDFLHHKILKDLNIKSVLEIGVGFGEFAGYCRKRGLDYVGIEPNDALRNQLIAQGFKVLSGSAPDLPPMDRKFDCVFMAHLIEHLAGYEEIIRLIEKSKKLLNPKGYLILLYPEVEKTQWLFYHDYTHTYVTSIRRVTNILEDCGLKVLRSSRYVGCWTATPTFFYYLGKIFPYFIFPEKVAYFLRLSFSVNAFTISQIPFMI